jgi:hypothetical protein
VPDAPFIHTAEVPVFFDERTVGVEVGNEVNIIYNWQSDVFGDCEWALILLQVRPTQVADPSRLMDKVSRSQHVHFTAPIEKKEPSSFDET